MARPIDADALKQEVLQFVKKHRDDPFRGELIHFTGVLALIVNAPTLESGAASKKKAKRNYYRKCGMCGKRQEQSEMIRTNLSPNGWFCVECNSCTDSDYYEDS